MITTYDGEIKVEVKEDEGRWASGEGYDIVISDALTLEGATQSLSEHMQMLAEHPNIDPMALQGALMSALMHQGGD